MTATPIVVDASSLVLAVTDSAAAGRHARQLLQGKRRHAPHLVDAEVGNVLRRMAIRGELSDEAASQARRLAERAIHRRHRHHGPLSDLAWRLRHDVTFYDALYVALAHALECPLLTADRHLASAVADRQPVEIV